MMGRRGGPDSVFEKEAPHYARGKFTLVGSAGSFSAQSDYYGLLA